MISKTIDKYVFFGTVVRYLQDVTPGLPIHPKNMIMDNLNSFFSNSESLHLHVTKEASYDLVLLKEELSKLAEESNLTQNYANKLQELMTQIRHTLFAELVGMEAFVTTPKRLDIKKLIGQIDELFAPHTFNKLPDIARFDLTEEGKCIAFERATAAAFHLLRATESILRAFYCSIVKQKRVDLMWGPMVLDLRKRKKAKKFETLLNHLDNIRLSFRNPTQHPEKIYDIQEVQDLWGVCVDAINRMAQVLN